MQIGIQSAQAGRLADPDAIRAVAGAAEALGYGSLWVVDRLDRSEGPVLDPLAVVATLAAVTDAPRLGTSVLVGPWYPPALLARSLDALDRLSGHRLEVGLGRGRSAAEREVAGISATHPGDRLDGVLDALDAMPWSGPRPTPDAAGIAGPRRLLAGSGGVALDRVARRADGWIATDLPLEALALLWRQVRDLADRHGRDAEALRLVVRAEVALGEEARTHADRPAFSGSLRQVADDLAALAVAGADEVILGVAGDPSVDEALDTWAQVIDALGDVHRPGGASAGGAAVHQ